MEAQDYGPPGDGYPMVAQSGLFIENDSPKSEVGRYGSTATAGH